MEKEYIYLWQTVINPTKGGTDMKTISKVESVLSKEVNNPDSVYLYREGDVWCAYERSAYYLARLASPLSLVKEIIGGGYDVVLLKAVFHIDDMGSLASPFVQLQQISRNKILLRMKSCTEGFREWKEKQLRYLSA